MKSVGVLEQLPSDIVKEVLSRPTVFRDEGPLSLEYVPARLPNREDKLSFLVQLFRFALERPASMSQRVLITGDVGTGKTVLCQRFGLDITKAAKNRKINLHYIHVNCRENKGSLFLIMKRTIEKLAPDFPKRGFAPEELLQVLMDMLDDQNAHLILALDELESLIQTEGSTPIYTLTRIQEERPGAPMRLSLVCILREPEYLNKLDPSTMGTLQRNFVRLEKYSADQLQGIISDRVSLAFKESAVPEATVSFLADVAGSGGDARYAIELLWRAGKYADSESSRTVSAEYVRKAIASVYPAMRTDYIAALSIHEKLLLLALSRLLIERDTPYISMGDVERQYQASCDEFNEEPRQHTQLWKYVRALSSIGVLSAQKSGEGMRGRTTLLGFAQVPASAMQQSLEAALEAARKAPRRYP
jgi:cell division control protein 6